MTMPMSARRKGWSRKQKRLALIAGLAVVLAIATALVLTALRDQIVFFYSPSDVVERSVRPATPSARRAGQGRLLDPFGTGEHLHHFRRQRRDRRPLYRHPPDLFREGQGVVAEGAMNEDGSFHASNVLAKHDENYIPKEVAEALKARGEWRPEGGE